jgi:uncharacterized protein (DUF433 family)
MIQSEAFKNRGGDRWRRGHRSSKSGKTQKRPITCNRGKQLRNGSFESPTFQRISIDPERRFGKPCVRGTRITVGDLLGWLASGMSFDAIATDYPAPTEADILACLGYAAAREQHSVRISLAA